MIILARTVSIAGQARPAAAVEWAREATKYINETLKPAHPLRVYQPLFGVLNKLTWTMDFEDLADYEAFMVRLESDAGYQQRLKASREAGNFDLTSLFVMTYRQIG